MSARSMVIHFGNAHELFDIDDANIPPVSDLLKRIQHRIYGDEELTVGSCDHLCDGPYAFEPLDDVRLRQIIEMVQQLDGADSIIEESERGKRRVELWLCNCNKTIFVRPNHLLIFYNFLLDTNNLFLFGNSSTMDEQHDSGDTRPVGNNDNSTGMHLQATSPSKKFVFFLCIY